MTKTTLHKPSLKMLVYMLKFVVYMLKFVEDMHACTIIFIVRQSHEKWDSRFLTKIVSVQNEA